MSLGKDKNLETLIGDMKFEVLAYVNQKLKLLKLISYEKISRIASSMGFGLIVLGIAVMIVFFILFGLAFFFGELLNSPAAGFGIMALICLIALLIIFVFRKNVKRSLLNKTILFIRNLEKDDDDE